MYDICFYYLLIYLYTKGGTREGRTPMDSDGLGWIPMDSDGKSRPTSDPAWSLGPGPWSLVPGPWSLGPGPWVLVPGPWALVLVPCPWSLVPGPWSLVPGPWSLSFVPGWIFRTPPKLKLAVSRNSLTYLGRCALMS